jgi:hypothetical protein
MRRFLFPWQLRLSKSLPHRPAHANAEDWHAIVCADCENLRESAVLTLAGRRADARICW